MIGRRLLLMFFMLKKKKLYPAHVSNREKQVIFLIIPKAEGWLYLAKNLLALLIEVNSKHKGIFCCLNCLHSFRAKSKTKSHKNCVKIQIFTIL